jgi:hypothetical protein
MTSLADMCPRILGAWERLRHLLDPWVLVLSCQVLMGLHRARMGLHRASLEATDVLGALEVVSTRIVVACARSGSFMLRSSSF